MPLPFTRRPIGLSPFLTKVNFEHQFLTIDTCHNFLAKGIVSYQGVASKLNEGVVRDKILPTK